MNKYYKLFVCGLLGLFLMGTVSAAVAAPQRRPLDAKAFKHYVAFQKKRQPAENTLVRPKVRREPVRNQNYRQNTARKALKSGHIVSLSVIRKRVGQSFPGKIVDVRLLEPRMSGRSYIYKVKVLRKDGKLLELKINAANAKIVGVKGNK